MLSSCQGRDDVISGFAKTLESYTWWYTLNRLDGSAGLNITIMLPFVLLPIFLKIEHSPKGASQKAFDGSKCVFCVNGVLSRGPIKLEGIENTNPKFWAGNANFSFFKKIKQ